MNFKDILANKTVTASVPCRIDFGGTLDISTFHLPLNRINPSSVNIALDMRTHVSLLPFEPHQVKVSSKGFETAVFEKGKAPFNHPMGLMFALAQYFDAHGVHIHIESTSPPRSALGGSSAAAVAIISAFFCCLGKSIDPEEAAWLAHYIEAGVAGVPCGIQDQLGAAFGGVHQWFWKMDRQGPGFKREPLLSEDGEKEFNGHILVAYCGIEHVSKDINKQWVDSFIQGKTRQEFKKIVQLTHNFAAAVKAANYADAADLMNAETRIRLGMTPDVLDNTGKKLFERAGRHHCGARFTGAGGGGCLWAIGNLDDIGTLKEEWAKILSPVEHAGILDTQIDHNGIIVSH